MKSAKTSSSEDTTTAMNVNLRERSDEELMRMYQMGNDEAFGVLFERYSPKIYGYLQKRLKNRFASDEIFQITFLKLHSSRDKYDSTFLFSSWIFTITRTSLADYFRKTGKIQEVAVENLEHESLSAIPSKELDLPMNQLTLKEKEAIDLRYGEDLSFDEIAQRLNTSDANVRKLVSRAVLRLKTLIEKS